MKVYQYETLYYKTEKQDYEKFSKSLKIVNDYYEKKIKNVNKKKHFWLLHKFSMVGLV